MVVRRIRVGACGQEYPNDAPLAISNIEQCDQERGVPEGVAGIDVRARGEQSFGDLGLLLLGGCVQRSETGAVGSVDVLTCVQGCLKIVEATFDSGVVQVGPSGTVRAHW